MLEQFLHHIDAHNLLSKDDKVLLAVSGGIDSMVMLHLFKESGLAAGVAHCNFQLRGRESDEDEEFVRHTAERYGFTVHCKRFETERIAANLGVSTQMAAREMRYEWFDELCNQYGYNRVATAHHLNDSFETVLLHLVKGTGLDGLAGIPVRHGKVVRPLLFATREQIQQYAVQHDIAWREDRSNESDDYQRNFIRLNVLPLLREINPSLDQTFAKTIERMSGGRSFASEYVRSFMAKAVREDGDRFHISRKAFHGIPYAAVLLWEIVKSYGFNYDQCCDVVGSGHQSGKVFRSSSSQLTIDRDDFIVTSLAEAEHESVMIQSRDTRIVNAHVELTIRTITREELTLSKSPAVAQLDAEKLSYPLVWRKWKDGDSFMPLGMTHHKKLSDFLVDEKVSLPDKKRVTLIESEGEVVWVVGHRIGDPFKVTASTKTVVILSVDKNLQ